MILSSESLRDYKWHVVSLMLFTRNIIGELKWYDSPVSDHYYLINLADIYQELQFDTVKHISLFEYIEHFAKISICIKLFSQVYFSDYEPFI
jgi:hypothetical protein